MVLVASESGTYYIAAGGAGTATGTYRLSVTVSTDDYPADASTTGIVSLLETKPGYGRRTITGNSTGGIDYEGDRDWFAVELGAYEQVWYAVEHAAYELYQIDLEGSQTGQGTLADPHLFGVYMADGTLVADTSADDGGEGANSLVSFLTTASGTYYVAAGAAGGTTGTYRLSVTLIDEFPADANTTGTIPRIGRSVGNGDDSAKGLYGNIEKTGDEDWIAFAVDEAGVEHRIRVSSPKMERHTNLSVLDSSGNDLSLYSRVRHRRSHFVSFTPEVVGTHYVSVTNNTGGWYGYGIYYVSVAEIQDDYVGQAGAATATVDGTVTGYMERIGDTDWFAVTLEADHAYEIVMDGGVWNPDLLDIHDADGDPIPGTRSDGRTGDARISFTPHEDGTYYVLATSRDRTTGPYTIAVTEVSDTPPTVPFSFTGKLRGNGDGEWFAVSLVADKLYQIDMKGVTGVNAGQYSIDLHDPYLKGVYSDYRTLIPGTTDSNGGHLLNDRIKFLAPESATCFIRAEATGPGPENHVNRAGTYRLSVTELDYADDYTADTGTTGSIVVDGSTTGSLEHSRDRDWFAVRLEAGIAYRLHAKGSVGVDYGGTLVDAALAVFDSAGDAIGGATNDNGGLYFNARLDSFTPETSGTYYLQVSAGSHPSGTGGTYTVLVENQ